MSIRTRVGAAMGLARSRAALLLVPLVAGLGLQAGCLSQEELDAPDYGADVDFSGLYDDDASDDASDDAGADAEADARSVDARGTEDARPADGGGTDAGPDDTPLFPDTAEDTAEDTAPPDVSSVRSCTTTIEHRPGDSAGRVAIAGEFNGWSATDDPLTGPDGDGIWTAELDLEPGEYAFKYVVDGVFEEAVPPDVYTKWLGSEENRALIVGDCDLPLLTPLRASATGEGAVTATLQFSSAADAVPIDLSTLVVTVGDRTVTPDVDVASGEITVSVEGLPRGKHSLRATAADTSGRTIENEPVFVPLWVEETPFRWEDATMYFVFVDRFRDSDGRVPGGAVDGVLPIANYLGGDLLGVLEAIEEGYFDELGVNLIWLSPVVENPDGRYLGIGANEGRWFSGYHGYWPVSGRTVEPKLAAGERSAEELLEAVVDAAHERGIRVLLDTVLNHVHDEHDYVDENPEWFADACGVCGSPGCGWEERPIDCLFTSYLPDLNYKNHEVTMQLTADIEWWAQRFDLDAFRVDAAKHMDHVIMRRMAMRLRDRFERAGGAPFYLVGETFVGQGQHSEIMRFVAPYELDGQFDFPLYWPIRNVFAGGGGFDFLDEQVRAGERSYRGALNSTFLGNHDIPRIATEIQFGDCCIPDQWSDFADPMAAGGSTVTQWDIVNRVSMGFLFVLTQPGVPLIYYGDEIGLAGAGDPDNRRMLRWSDLSANQLELRSRIRTIGRARRDHVAARRGARRTLHVDADLYVYGRASAPGEVVIIAMNRGDGTRSVSIEPPSEWAIDGARLEDALGGSRSIVLRDGRATIELDSWEYAMFAPAGR